MRAHGHLKKAEKEALYSYGQTHKMHVLYIHESEGREIEFIRLYPRKIVKEESVKWGTRDVKLQES